MAYIVLQSAVNDYKVIKIQELSYAAEIMSANA